MEKVNPNQLSTRHQHLQGRPQFPSKRRHRRPLTSPEDRQLTANLAGAMTRIGAGLPSEDSSEASNVMLSHRRTRVFAINRLCILVLNDRPAMQCLLQAEDRRGMPDPGRWRNVRRSMAER